MDDVHHYLALAAAFVRGRLQLPLATPDDEAVARGLDVGLRLHKFKRNAELPRVRRVVNMLRGLAPAELLDIGPGRGVFLWPLLDIFQSLQVTAVDLDRARARDVSAVARGGVSRLQSCCASVAALPFGASTFEVVTALEVLEHVHRPELAAVELLRVAHRAVIASVPDGPDSNPQHIHFIDPPALEAMLIDAGARRVSLAPVRGHTVAVASVA